MPNKVVSKRKRQPFPVSNQHHRAKTLHPLTGVIFGVCLLGSLAGFLFHQDQQRPRVVAYMVEDVSKSAQAFPLLSQETCGQLVKNLIPGDLLGGIYFAASAEETFPQKVQNILLTQSPCHDSSNREGLPPSNLSYESGTSLIRALEMMRSSQARLRREGFREPVLYLITLHEAEAGNPGSDQPTLDFNQVRRLSQQVLDDHGVIVIIGPTGMLYQHLRANLPEGARLFPSDAIAEAVAWGFAQSRSQK